MGQLEKPPKAEGLGWRHVQVFIMFVCISSAITMRVCLSVAVVDMTGTDEAGDGMPRFDWAPTEKSAVLGSFLWGYMCTQVVGGALSSRGHATLIMTVALTISSVLTALLPLAATKAGWGAVTALRIITGVIQGTIYPTAFTLMGRWVPPEERSRAGAVIFSAQSMGNILALALSGWIAFQWGWPAVFYAFGASGVVAAVLFFFMTADEPESHPRISQAERDYIITAITASATPRRQMAVPWIAMLTSTALWAALAAHIGYLWGYWVILTSMPSYLNNLLEVSIQWIGLLSAVPYVSMLLFSILFGWLGDLLEAKQWVSLSNNRKILNSIGEVGPGVLCLLIAALGTQYPVLAVSLLVLCGGVMSSVFSGGLINFLDLSPNFSGIAFGLGNTIGSFISAFAPYAEGIFVDRKDPLPGWSNVFYLTAAVYLVFNVLFCVWGTAEVQPWNSPPAPRTLEEPPPAAKGLDNTAFNHKD